MSKIIRTCLGEYVKEGDVLYDHQTDTYKIKAGDRLVEIDGHALQSENLRTLQEALSNVDDENIKIDMLGSWAKDLDAKYRRTYLGEWGPDRTDKAKTAVETAAEAEAKARFAEARARMSEAKAMSSKTTAATGPAGAPFDSQSQDPLRARVEAGAWKIDGLGAAVRPVDMGDWSIRISDEAAQKITGTKTYGDAARKLRANSVYGVGTASHTSAPWDDPLKDQIDKANNTVACCDLPELRPDYNPKDKVKVYYRDRFPSIPIRSIIDDAIELLNNKKNLHITKISFSQSHPDFRLAISSRIPERPGYVKTLEVLINHTAFDRAYKTELDGYAKLKARLDTNTYIKLRIAFLLYQALKLRDEDARKISLDIFRIIGSDTRPGFHF